jgi:hypothetical protein
MERESLRERELMRAAREEYRPLEEVEASSHDGPSASMVIRARAALVILGVLWLSLGISVAQTGGGTVPIASLALSVLGLAHLVLALLPNNRVVLGLAQVLAQFSRLFPY